MGGTNAFEALPLFLRVMTNLVFNEAPSLLCLFPSVPNLLEVKRLLCSLIPSCFQLQDWGSYLLLHRAHMFPPFDLTWGSQERGSQECVRDPSKSTKKQRALKKKI